jgi:hypothetical protein
MEVFQKKAEIIARAEKLPYDIAISYIAEPRRNLSVLIAQAADSLLDIRGMKASFVLGVEENGSVRISARSLGEVNVQMIVEKIGGGGNLTTAGAQLHGSLRDAKIQLVEAIDKYMADMTEKTKQPMFVQKQFRDTIRIPGLPSEKSESSAETAAGTQPDSGNRASNSALSRNSGKYRIQKEEKQVTRGIPNIE